MCLINQTTLKTKEFTTVASEKKILAKGINKKSSHEEGEIISPILLREKPDGSHRLIFSLKETIKFVENGNNHHYFQ